MRKNKNLFTAVLIILMLTGNSFAQATHEVTVTNFSFSPAELTISVGDAVKWINVLGNHNVLADDGSFTSGSVAPAPWEYTHTFTTAGNNPYYCEPHGGPGGSGMAGVIIVQNPSDVNDDGVIAGEFELEQNYPNPFNPSTRISYTIPSASLVNLKVYDAIGNEITTLVNEEKQSGIYSVDFDATDLTGGIYFYQIISGSFVKTKKMILLK